MLSHEELEKIAKAVALEMGYVEHPENDQQRNVVSLILKALRTVRDDAYALGYEKCLSKYD